MEAADAHREVPFHQSANRPNQLLGADRELVIVSVLIAVGLALSLGSGWGFGLAVAWWAGSIAVLKRMGKADPMLRQIYLRHIRYLPFYPAKSGLYSRCLQTRARWK
jgi:type IV secretory pathway TrbD component